MRNWLPMSEQMIDFEQVEAMGISREAYDEERSKTDNKIRRGIQRQADVC